MSYCDIFDARMAQMMAYYQDSIDFESDLKAGIRTEADRPVRPEWMDHMRVPFGYGTIARKR